MRLQAGDTRSAAVRNGGQVAACVHRFSVAATIPTLFNRTTLSFQPPAEDTMVSRRVSAALIAFGITLASVFAAAHDGRKDRDDDENGRDEARIRQGFEIAPVPLHFKKKDHDLVGLGSYIVNAQGGCNDCHTNPPYATGGDPHLGQPKVVNSTHY